MNMKARARLVVAGTGPRRPPDPPRRRRRFLNKGHIPYAQHSSSETKRSELLEGTFRTPFLLNFLPFDRGGDGGITKPPSVPQDCVRRTDESILSSAASRRKAS